MAKLRKETAQSNIPLRYPEKISLERHFWRNWFLLAAVTLISTIGLATAILPLLSERIVNPWPWGKTDLVLLVGLSLIVIAFIGYLTQQQRHVASILKRLKLLQEEMNEHIRQDNSRLYALFNVSKIMSTKTDLQSVFDAITETCVEVFACYRASLMLIDNEAQELVVRSVSGFSSRNIIDMRQRIGEGIAGWAAAHCEALLLGGPSDFENYPELECNNPSICSAMVVPVVLRDDAVGVLNVSANSPDTKYDAEDLKAIQVFAENAGACIRHQEQAEWMRSTIRNMQKGGSSNKNMCTKHNVIEVTDSNEDF